MIGLRKIVWPLDAPVAEDMMDFFHCIDIFNCWKKSFPIVNNEKFWNSTCLHLILPTNNIIIAYFFSSVIKCYCFFYSVHSNLYMNSGVNFFSELYIDAINGESRITQIMKYCRAICFACLVDDRLNWMKRQWHCCWIGPGTIFFIICSA